MLERSKPFTNPTLQLSKAGLFGPLHASGTRLEAYQQIKIRACCVKAKPCALLVVGLVTKTRQHCQIAVGQPLKVTSEKRNMGLKRV